MPTSWVPPQPGAELELARKLIAVGFDRCGTPTTKLPSCWRCEEDELCCPSPHVRLRQWQCLRCNWIFEHTPLHLEDGHG